MKMLLCFIFLFFATDCLSQDLPAEPLPAMPASEGQNVVNMINLERFNLGLKPLKFSDQLTCASSLHSAWLFRTDRCQHTGPGVQTFQLRAQICGGSARGEVIGCGQGSFFEVVRDWMNDPRHREMILDPDMTEIGAANMGYKWVAVLNK